MAAARVGPEGQSELSAIEGGEGGPDGGRAEGGGEQPDTESRRGNRHRHGWLQCYLKLAKTQAFAVSSARCT